MISKSTNVLVCFFIFLCFLFATATQTQALNLDKAKEYFLKGDYQASISECERILAAGERFKGIDELYFILGLSYLKKADYLRSYDVFQIIIEEFPESRYQQEAILGQADIDFMKNDYYVALLNYREIVKRDSDKELRPAIYLRLVRANLKNGYWQEAKLYAERLKNEYPLSPETYLTRDMVPPDLYFTVQVGAFSKKENAEGLCEELTQRDYPAFIQETYSDSTKLYRVRVGKLQDFNHAVELQEELKNLGYPTKIYP